ncbi:hypothetical protein ACTWPT_32145 [Nonomuraea sp. 3N208]|uniref:hypothetical protein n=1 Tax=Nonomuraea sp. 3N208 TaxID=3457421 RepID=UPI003FD48FB6
MATAATASRSGSTAANFGIYSTISADTEAWEALPRGYLLQHGRLTKIDVPGAMRPQPPDIDNKGEIVGE